MVVRIKVAPELLHWAVQRAGWDAETVARRAPTLKEWTSGARQPTLKQLERFANDTHTPFGLLFLPTPPVEEMPIPDMRTMGNRATPRPSADLLDTIYLCQSRQEWYRDHAQENLATEREFVGSVTAATAPELVADQIRDILSFDLTERGLFSSWEDALRRLIDRFENIGVLVMVSGIVGTNTHRVLDPQEFRGFALTDPLAPLIFVNGTDTKAAQIFTLIHELAHIWLGKSGVSDAAMTSPPGISDELWCNKVAAEVLVPLAALRVDYRGDTESSELERLARKYRVSTLVVLKRLFDATFLDWTAYQTLYQMEYERVLRILATRKAEDSGGNYYYTQPLRLSRQFARAVIASTIEGTTTYRDAYRLLGTRKHSTFEGLAAELGVA